MEGEDARTRMHTHTRARVSAKESVLFLGRRAARRVVSPPYVVAPSSGIQSFSGYKRRTKVVNTQAAADPNSVCTCFPIDFLIRMYKAFLQGDNAYGNSRVNVKFCYLNPKKVNLHSDV